MTLATSFPADGDPTTVAADVVLQLPDRLRGAACSSRPAAPTVPPWQPTRRLDPGRPGRTSAATVDKVLGWALQHGQLPLAGQLLVLSGRAGVRVGAEGGDGRGSWRSSDWTALKSNSRLDGSIQCPKAEHFRQCVVVKPVLMEKLAAPTQRNQNAQQPKDE